jgi:hypothetical protein
MIKGYSFADKKKTTIKSKLSLRKYKLPNGNTVSIICGKDKKLHVICTIAANEKIKARKPASKKRPASKRK